jgi:hypothetical protein
MVIKAATPEIREHVADVIQGEIKLLAKELGMRPQGPGFKALVERITKAATLSMELGDEAFTHVQRIIDKEKRLYTKHRTNTHE